jgi:hypothetical protein
VRAASARMTKPVSIAAAGQASHRYRSHDSGNRWVATLTMTGSDVDRRHAGWREKPVAGIAGLLAAHAEKWREARRPAPPANAPTAADAFPLSAGIARPVPTLHSHSTARTGCGPSCGSWAVR